MGALSRSNKGNNAEADTAEGDGRPATSNGISDLADLWNNAVKKYCKATKRSPSDLEQIDDFAEAMTGTSTTAGMFDETRHPKTKMNTVMTTVEPCMDWIQTGVTFIADHATGTMASPAKAIAGATAYLIQAAQNMTADLDLVVACFTRIKDAMGDLSILQGLVPSHEHFHLRLMTVFTTILDFCGFTTSYFAKGFRRRMYFKSLISGRNEQISAQSTAVEKAVKSFRETIPVSSLALTVGMDRKVDNMPQAVIDAVIKAAATSDFDPATFIPRNDALKQVKKFFDPKSGSRTQADAARFKDIASFFERVSLENSYKQWLEGREKPFLWVKGPSGCGKSYFVHSMISKLRKLNKDDSNVLVASLFFLPGKRETQTLLNALGNLIIQIAEQDSKYNEQIAKELKKVSVNDDRSPNIFKKKVGKLEDLKSEGDLAVLWKEFILEKFTRASDGMSRTLYLLLDGLDQFDFKERDELLSNFNKLSGERYMIRVLFTSDESLDDDVRRLSYESIALNELNKQDLAIFIDKRYQSSQALRNFSEKTKKSAKETLIDKAKGIFAYVDVAMRRIEQIGVEANALDFLNRQSPGTEGLYKHMTDNLTNLRTVDDLTAVKTLYKWVVYAKRSLSIYELEQLLELDNGTTDFDIEKEVNAGGSSSSVLYLQVASNEDRLAAVIERDPNSMQSPEDIPGVPAKDRRTTSVSFLQGSFQEYLQNLDKPNKLIESKNGARVEIFSLLCDIICGARQMKSETRSALRNYAVINLLAHLMAIDIDSASKEETRVVVEGLAQVMINTNDASGIIEAVVQEKRISSGLSFSRYEAPGFDLYEDFGTSLYGSRRPKQVIGAWASKVRYHGGEDLTPKCAKWVKQTVQTDGSRLLNTLIKGHVLSWFTKVTEEEAWLCFKLACEAILEGDVVPTSKREFFYYWTNNPSEKTLKCTLRALAEGKKSLEITPRARIAMALLANSVESTSEPNQPSQSYALKLYEQNLKDDQSGKEVLSGAERFYTLVGLGEYHFQGSRWQEAADRAESALKQHEQERAALGSDLDSSRLRAAFSIRARALQNLGPEFDEQAVKVFETGLETLAFSRSLVEFLDGIATVLSRNSKHLELMQKVQQWPQERRNTWLASRSFESTSRNLELRKAAVHTRRADLLVRFYEDAIEAYKLLSVSLFLRYELAIIYRRDLRLAKVAKRTLYELLDAVGNVPVLIELSGPRMAGPEFLNLAREELLEICYDQFSTSHDHKRKEELVQEVQILKRDITNSRDYRSAIEDAQFDLFLASMSADLGNWRDTKTYTNKAFNACIEDLEDKIGGNDSSAFRLLGKVLAFASTADNRLLADARIALSLQFSAVDETYEDVRRYSLSLPRSSINSERGFEDIDNEDEDKGDDKATDDGNKDDDKPPLSPIGSLPADPVTLDVPEDSPSTGAKPADLPVSIEKTGTLSTHGESGENAVKSVTSDPAEEIKIPEDTTGDLVNEAATTKAPLSDSTEEVRKVPGPPSNSADAEPSPDAKHGELQDSLSEAALIPPPDLNDQPVQGQELGPPNEDLEEYCTISCNGFCERLSYGWWETKSPQYRCLTCREVDLCEECYRTQVAFKDGREEGFWSAICSSHHEYLRQPIEGWLGVRAGVIRTKEKNRKFREWLQDVKNRYRTMDWKTLTARRQEAAQVEH